jgi:Ferritin-like domain
VAQLSRRDLLKSAGIAGISAAGISTWFGGMGRVFAQEGADTLELIVNLAATAETFACTHYYTVLTDSNIQLSPAERAILVAALDTELQHLDLLNSKGATALATEFYAPQNIYSNRQQFSDITEQIETAFVATYLAANRRIAELGDPITAATTAQIAVTEQVHLALIRQIGGKLPNHVSLGQALFYNPSEALPVLQPFIEGGEGFTGPLRFPGDDVIFDFVGQSGVMTIATFAEPSS